MITSSLGTPGSEALSLQEKNVLRQKQRTTATSINLFIKTMETTSKNSNMKKYLAATLLIFVSQLSQAQNVGIGITTPKARLHVADSAVLFTGPPNTISLQPPPISGPGIRMMWYPQRASFRAGFIENNQWDRDNIGLFSFATGYNSKALGQSTVSMGQNTTASAFGATSMGAATLASGFFSTSMGTLTIASGEAATSMGNNTHAIGNSATAMGTGTKAKSNNSLALGMYNDTTTGTNERLFEIGNGISDNARSNVLTVLTTGHVGIGTILPKAGLHVADSAVLFTGPASLSFTYPPPVSGPGTRMMWYPEKGAFRAGSVGTDFWDQENVGWNSFASGKNTKASGQAATSMGEYNIATGVGSTGMGTNNVASGYSSTSMGGFTWANGEYSTTMGKLTSAAGIASTAMGTGTKAISNYSVAIGMYNNINAGISERLFEIGNGTAENDRRNAFTVLANGHVGIGTARPGYGHVSTNRILEIFNSDQNDGRSNIILSDSTNIGSMGGITWRSRFIPLSDGVMANISTTMEFSGYPSYPKGAMHFSTSNQNNLVERLTINALGYIGIGNTAPNAPLQIGNALRNRQLVLFESGNNDNQFYGFGIDNGMLRYQTDGGDHTFYAATGTSSSQELMRIKGNGNVGIGNSTPNASLQFGNNFSNRKIVLWETANNDHQFYGIGITSTVLRYQTDATVADHVFFAGTGPTTSQELMRIKGNGRVGIGTSTPSQALQVAGNILASGTITPSDARYKQHIAAITDPLEKLEQLTGVTYNYRPEDFPDMNFSDEQQVGLIAQDVEKVFPQLVFEDDKGYKGVDYVKLIPVLIEALKNQEKHLKTLEAQNIKQQQQIETLIKKIEAISKK